MLDDSEETNGRKAHHYPELRSPVMMTVYTRAPEKWLLVDRETGEVYQGNFIGTWDLLDYSTTDEKRAADAKKRI